MHRQPFADTLVTGFAKRTPNLSALYAMSLTHLVLSQVPWMKDHKLNKKSTVYSNGFVTSAGARDLDDQVATWLVDSKISRVFTGHKPQGDCPSAIRDKRGVYVLICDTSYSDVTKAHVDNDWDLRGRAVTTVRIDATSTTVHGLLASGKEHG